MSRVGRIALAMVLSGAARVAAQAPVPPLPDLPLLPPGERQMNITVLGGPLGDTRTVMSLSGGQEFDFFTAPLAVGGAPVAGAPYSGDAVTEVVQTLADGNRIVRQSKAALYRDSRGRTRREQGLAVLGNLVAGDDGRALVQIHDPDTGSMYLLDTKQRTASRLPNPKVHLSTPAPDHAPSLETFAIETAPGRGMSTTFFRRRAAADDGKVEALGTRTIEGVATEGTRATLVIPAGQIGNEQPINIVSERWYSSELKTLVMSRQSDPRFGETTYRLTNIVRAEPPPELFQVPADYRVVDPTQGLEQRMEERIRSRRK